MATSPTTKLALATALAFALSSSAYADQIDDFRTAQKVSGIAALGAKQMAGASIQKVFAGRTLKNPGWTWSLNKNGVQTSKALDGSWSDNGTWEVRGNQFCRKSELSKGKELCSKVYFLGRDLKFGDPDNAKKLSEWYVTY